MAHLLHGKAAPWNRALQTPVPPWIQGLMVYRVPCIRWSVAVDPLSATAAPLHLTQFAVPFVQIVATVCLQGMWFHTIFLWHVQCMVHCSLALGWSNPLFFEPVVTSPHPAVWLRKVGLISSQSEPWVDATCSLKICAENQALANHPCSVEHVLRHALVKYTIQLALQNKFSYTWYNRVVWALLLYAKCALVHYSSAPALHTEQQWTYTLCTLISHNSSTAYPISAVNLHPMYFSQP